MTTEITIIEYPSFPCGASIRVFQVVLAELPKKFESLSGQYIEGYIDTSMGKSSENDTTLSDIVEFLEEQQCLKEMEPTYSIVRQALQPITTKIVIHNGTYY